MTTKALKQRICLEYREPTMIRSILYAKCFKYVREGKSNNNHQLAVQQNPVGSHRFSHPTTNTFVPTPPSASLQMSIVSATLEFILWETLQLKFDALTLLSIQKKRQNFNDFTDEWERRHCFVRDEQNSFPVTSPASWAIWTDSLGRQRHSAVCFQVLLVSTTKNPGHHFSGLRDSVGLWVRGFQ